jgi:hypothetical protein
MVGKIFINYRRGDEAGFTQALYLRLESEFASGDLFMDVEGHIKPGDDFVEVLSAQVAASDVILAVIGPRWSELLTARQGEPDDFLAIELKAALDQHKRVIPVLVGGASMPRADSLPEAIRPLARRNAVGLRPERFKADCQGLVAALNESLAAAEQERAARTEAERKAAEAVRLEAEEQAAARSKAAEERGRTEAMAGLSAADVRKAEELANWDFVKDRNDVQEMRDHLARFPGGMTERYALARLDGLVWSGLGATPKIEQLRAYLDEFPKGANAGGARGRIAALQREAAEARAAEPGACPKASDSTWGQGDRPVINLSWNDAKQYVAWLSRTTGKEYRLLSEAEWEYVARAGSTTTYSWGDVIGKNNATCARCGSQWDNKQTAPVGSFKQNAWGLYDMHGNVFEWVEDPWHDSYKGAPTGGSPWVEDGDASRRVVRGGSWDNVPLYLRVATRSGNSTGYRFNYVGFRLARTLSP